MDNINILFCVASYSASAEITVIVKLCVWLLYLILTDHRANWHTDISNSTQSTNYSPLQEYNSFA